MWSVERGIAQWVKFGVCSVECGVSSVEYEV